MRAALILAILGGIAIVWGCSCGGGDARRDQTIAWKSCGGGFDCGMLSVPMDYSHPNDKQITLALTRLRAADPNRRIGVLLLSPGGPGESGINAAHVAANSFPSAIRARFDIVGWDPRGSGESSPVRCGETGASSSGGESTGAGEDAAISQSIEQLMAFGESCLRETGEELRFVDTTSSARDMEQIRTALHEKSFSFIGYSYGTFLGAQYAELYPSRVRAFVLDSALDPALGFEAEAEGRAVAAEGALRTFLADCAADSGCPFYDDGHSAAEFERLRDALDRNPIVAHLQSGDMKLDGPAFIQAVYQILMTGDWRTLARALSDADFSRDGTLLTSLVRTGNVRTTADQGDARVATLCLDNPRPSRNELIASATRIDTEAPDFVGPIDTGCDGWPIAPTWHAHELNARGSPPILVIGSVHDPVTPYEWSVSLARQLTHGVLLSSEGHFHAVSFHSPSLSPCIDAAVTAYLDNLVTPTPGAICP